VSGSEVGRGGRRTVELFYNELWDARRLELLDELIAPNLRFRSSLGTVINGREAFGRYIDTVHRAFPDWRHSIDEMFVVEDRVITRMTWTGTHEGSPRRRRASRCAGGVCGSRVFQSYRRRDPRGLGGRRYAGGVAGAR
jgi:hypothetical protein